MKKVIIVLLIVFGGWKLLSSPGSVTLGPGVLAGVEPYQDSVEPAVSRSIENYTITDLATFRIKAKVLSRKDYVIGREADLSPVDLALGWGNMSDESVLSNIEISQSGRFYRWQVESFPIPRREIETHSANMHLIPANEAVKDEIEKVREGEIIEISGSLVEVLSGNDGWRWTSSMTRTDTGSGACELILVDSFNIVTP
jgi:hypothetical protein